MSGDIVAEMQLAVEEADDPWIVSICERAADHIVTLTADLAVERAEVERLRAEVERLRAERDASRRIINDPDDTATEIVLLGRTFALATNDGRQGWEFRYVDHQPYPVWFGTESTDLTRHLAAALDEIVRLRAAIDNFVAEVDDDHQPEWASEQAKANGKKGWCRWCGPQDGGWPCCHRMSLDALKEARRER